MRTIKFICDSKEIINGQFEIEHLQTFSKNTKSIVIVPNYAKIENGIIEYFNEANHE